MKHTALLLLALISYSQTFMLEKKKLGETQTVTDWEACGGGSYMRINSITVDKTLIPAEQAQGLAMWDITYHINGTAKHDVHFNQVNVDIKFEGALNWKAQDIVNLHDNYGPGEDLTYNINRQYHEWVFGPGSYLVQMDFLDYSYSHAIHQEACYKFHFTI